MDYEDIARQARDVGNARKQAHENAVQKRMRELNIPRDLAEYLIDLERRIGALEQRGQ